MPNKAPEDATIDELETFLRSHEVPIPATREDPRYHSILIERSKILLRIMGRDSLRVERRSILNKLINKARRRTPTGVPTTETEYAMSMASEPVLARRKNVNERRSERHKLSVIHNFQGEFEGDSYTEPEYAEPPQTLPHQFVNQLRELAITPTAPKFSQDIPPPLPPRPHFMAMSSDPASSSNPGSLVEAARIPPTKRVRQSTDIESPIGQDLSMRNIESPKIDHTPPVVVQTKSYTTKFTTIFNDATDDIEQYLIALRRWQRLNNITDRVAISVALQNFKNCELSNYTETSLTENAFLSLTTFCEEVTRMLGKTSNQWLDQFDSIKRRNTESCFTFFARLQTVLKNALGVANLNSEHKRLIVRKFLKSIHPTLRGHLESRDDPINFENCAMIANRIELALGLPKGGTVTELHNITSSERPPKRYQNRAKHFCHICNKEGSHATAFCYGNPNSANFDLDKFKVISGLSKN